MFARLQSITRNKEGDPEPGLPPPQDTPGKSRFVKRQEGSTQPIEPSPRR
jgi:hypothetical protein